MRAWDAQLGGEPRGIPEGRHKEGAGARVGGEFAERLLGLLQVKVTSEEGIEHHEFHVKVPFQELQLCVGSGEASGPETGQ